MQPVQPLVPNHDCLSALRPRRLWIRANTPRRSLRGSNRDHGTELTRPRIFGIFLAPQNEDCTKTFKGSPLIRWVIRVTMGIPSDRLLFIVVNANYSSVSLDRFTWDYFYAISCNYSTLQGKLFENDVTRVHLSAEPLSRNRTND